MPERYGDRLEHSISVDVLVAVNLQIFGAQLNHICLFNKKAGNSEKTKLF